MEPEIKPEVVSPLEVEAREELESQVVDETPKEDEESAEVLGDVPPSDMEPGEIPAHA